MGITTAGHSAKKEHKVANRLYISIGIALAVIVGLILLYVSTTKTPVVPQQVPHQESEPSQREATPVDAAPPAEVPPSSP